MYRGKKQYLVRWKGYSDDSDTWENESVLNSCAEVLEAFNKENAEKEATNNENSEDENQVEENAMAKKKGRQNDAKKRTKNEKATLPPKKARREEEKTGDEGDESAEKDYEVSCPSVGQFSLLNIKLS